MKNWKGIDEFLAVAETGSFSKAGERLNVVVSQVSKRVTELETSLNTKLFDRSTRTVGLTTQGHLLYQASQQVLAQFQQIQDNIQAGSNAITGTVRLCTVGGSRPAFQMEIYRAFLDKYPSLTLEVLYYDQVPDLTREEIDLVLVINDIDSTAHKAAFHLCWIDYGLIASPNLMASHATPAKPADLENLPCIINDEHYWRLGNGETSVKVNISGHFASSNMPACIDACISGLGVFMTPTYSIDSLLNNGRAVRLLPEWQIRKPLYALLRSAEYVPAKVILLLEFLAETMGADKGEAGTLFQTLEHARQGSTNILQEMNNNAQNAGKTLRENQGLRRK